MLPKEKTEYLLRHAYPKLDEEYSHTPLPDGAFLLDIKGHNDDLSFEAQVIDAKIRRVADKAMLEGDINKAGRVSNMREGHLWTLHTWKVAAKIIDDSETDDGVIVAGEVLRQGANPARDTYVFVKLACPVARRIRNGRLQYFITTENMKDLILEDYTKDTTPKEAALVTDDEIDFYISDSDCMIEFARDVFDCPGPGNAIDFRAKLLKVIAPDDPVDSAPEKKRRKCVSKLDGENRLFNTMSRKTADFERTCMQMENAFFCDSAEEDSQDSMEE